MLLDEGEVLLRLLAAAQHVRAHDLPKTDTSQWPRPSNAPTTGRPRVMPVDEGLCRRMDIILYTLYSRDEKFVYDMVARVVNEVATRYEHPPLSALLEHNDRPVLFHCLFFLMLNFHTDFRYWILSDAASATNGLPPVCPYKMCRFLVTLREEIIPDFLVHETTTMAEFVRSIKKAYIAS